MSTSLTLRSGRYAVLEGNLDSQEPTALGILLEDPESGQLYMRLRQDLTKLPDDDSMLPILEDDLRAKGAEWGTAGLFAWLQEHISSNLRIKEPETVAVDVFERTLNRLYAKHVHSSKDDSRHVPRFTLRAAAGRLLDNQEIEELGSEEIPRDVAQVTPDMFAAEISGTSMEPHIPDGSVCLFRHGVTGSRSGRLVLVEELGRGGNDRYTVKRYRREGVRSEDGMGVVILEPLNPEHQAFRLIPEEDRYRVIAEFLRVLY